MAETRPDRLNAVPFAPVGCPLPITNADNLPEYPMPDTREVVGRFMEWAEAIVDKQQWESLRDAADELLAWDRLPAVERTIAQRGSFSGDSWLFDAWANTYLTSRAPLVPYTSVPITFDHPTLEGRGQAAVAACIAAGLAQVYLDFRARGTGGYAVGKYRFSNDQMVGGLAAINHIASGANHYYIAEAVSRHIIVLVDNTIYSVEAINADGDAIDPAVLEAQLRTLRDSGGTGLNVNALTGHNDLDAAGRVLARILDDPTNAANYQRIKDAICVVCLDSAISGQALVSGERPSAIERLDAICGHPDTFNRWHGKSLQITVDHAGRAGLITDHTFCDGGTEAYMISLLVEQLEAASGGATAGFAPPEELAFSLNDDDAAAIEEAHASFRAGMDAFSSIQVEIPELSRRRLRENGVLSGDGFIHAAMTAAQIATWGSPQNTYISVDCRTFFRGRTETMRPVSQQAVDFVAALRGGEPASRVRELLDAALDEHYRRTKQCQQANGVHRYLFIMEDTIRRYADELGVEAVPRFFTEPGYAAMDHNTLSCTSFGTDEMKYVYFPPVVPHGLGIFYRVADTTTLIVSSFDADGDLGERFVGELRRAVAQMLEVIEQG